MVMPRVHASRIAEFASGGTPLGRDAACGAPSETFAALVVLKNGPRRMARPACWLSSTSSSPSLSVCTRNQRNRMSNLCSLFDKGPLITWRGMAWENLARAREAMCLAIEFDTKGFFLYNGGRSDHGGRSSKRMDFLYNGWRTLPRQFFFRESPIVYFMKARIPTARWW